MLLLRLISEGRRSCPAFPSFQSPSVCKDVIPSPAIFSNQRDCSLSLSLSLRLSYPIHLIETVAPSTFLTTQPCGTSARELRCDLSVVPLPSLFYFVIPRACVCVTRRRRDATMRTNNRYVAYPPSPSFPSPFECVRPTDTLFQRPPPPASPYIPFTNAFGLNEGGWSRPQQT